MVAVRVLGDARFSIAGDIFVVGDVFETNQETADMHIRLGRLELVDKPEVVPDPPPTEPEVEKPTDPATEPEVVPDDEAEVPEAPPEPDRRVNVPVIVKPGFDPGRGNRRGRGADQV